MNVFWFEPFDGNKSIKEVLRLNAQQHPNVYLNKLQIEAVQVLSAANIIHGCSAPYSMSHGRNPLNLYASECLENWILLYWYVEALEEERHYRYYTGGKPHKSYLALKSMTPPPSLKRNGIPLVPPRCMPDKYKTESLIISYRNYFNMEKVHNQHINGWGNRPEPKWLNYDYELIQDDPLKFDRDAQIRALARDFDIPRNGTRIN